MCAAATPTSPIPRHRYHVVGAVRDMDKMEAVAEIEGWDPKSFTPMECELQSFQSVRTFVDEVNCSSVGRPVRGEGEASDSTRPTASVPLCSAQPIQVRQAPRPADLQRRDLPALPRLCQVERGRY